MTGTAVALNALQDRFQAYLLHDENTIFQDVVAAPDIDPKQRLGIYHNAYRSRLVEALRTDYTALPLVMGDAGFEQAALRYITASPSVHRNLRWYGQGLSAFLRASAPYAGEPWLADLAEFEWTITLAFDAADQDSLTFAQVATLDPAAWPTVSFRFHPSLRCLRLRTNAPFLRKMSEEEGQVPPAEVLAEEVCWMLWRKDLGVLYRSLSTEEAWALDAARDGADFTQLCEGLCRWIAPEAAAGQLAGMLRTWVDDQLIVGLDTPST